MTTQWLAGIAIALGLLAMGPALAAGGGSPDAPAFERLRWALDALEVGADVRPEDTFAPAFLEKIPSNVIIASVAEVAGETGGLTLVGLRDSTAYAVTAIARARSNGSCWRVELRVESEEPHGITRILYVNDPVLGVQQGDGWPDLEGQMEALPGRGTLAAYAIRDDERTTLFEYNAAEPLAIGSVFKLWVLGSLAEAVGAGSLAWEQEIPIRDAWKSLPSGKMQDLPEGETRTVAEYATQMIAISDNTATDHLMRLLGRDVVSEFALTHGSPSEKNRPLLLTREFFQLKLVADRDLRTKYVEADPKLRARLLEEKVRTLPLSPATAQNDSPLAIDTIEYFSSAADVARTMQYVFALREQPGLEPVEAALTENRGLSWDEDRWPTVAYKGGSEPGVLYTAWLLERFDGQQFILCFGSNDSREVENVDRCIRIIQAAAEILARKE